MDNRSSYLIKLALWLGKTLGEGSILLAEMDTDAFGIGLPESVTSHTAILNASDVLSSVGSALTESVNELEISIESEDNSEVITSVSKLGENLVELTHALELYITEFKKQINGTNIPNLNERQIAQDFIFGLSRKIIDYQLISAIESANPEFLFLLKLAGLIEWSKIYPDTDNPIGVSYFKKSLNFHYIPDFISNPGQHFIDRIGWGSNDFDPSDIFYTVEGFYDEEDSILIGVLDDEPYLQRGIFRFRKDNSTTPPGLAIDINASLSENINNRIEINDNWGIGIDTGIQFDGGLIVNFSAPFSLSITPLTGEVKGILKSFIDRNETTTPYEIIGSNSLLKLSAHNTSLGVGLDASFDAVNGSTEVDPLVSADIKGLKLELGSGEGDGFLDKILASTEIEGQFDLGLEWRGDDGLIVKASGGVEILIPLHQNLGPIEIDSVFLALRIQPDSALELEMSTIFSAKLGTLTASVERMGGIGRLYFGEGNESKYGFFDLSLDFKPPNGVGLSLDAGAVKGGGYLFFDFDREEYAGALELVFSEWIALRAIGLVTTKMPDGSKGFSMVIIVTVEFGSGLQLGLGFTLLGVGGLLGLNRTVNVQPLAEGVRTGAVESVMFPQDIIANAPKIISDLKQFFPVYQDQFLIGPMAKIAYGTPTLASLSLGVIIEFPEVTITILGVLKVVLPTEEADVLKLQVNFIGRIEPANSLLWFYAELYDSRILFITIEGGMGLLVNWGENSNFVFSIGGFHPQYAPPPLPFPSPPRLAVSLLNEEYAKVRIEGYFAVTSNSVQFGAKVEVFFGVDAFNIDGHFGFDALFQFDPFYFSFSLSVGLSVKLFGVGLFSVGFSGLIEGPTPWHIKGHGKIGFLFFSVSVPFEETWGEERGTELPPIEILPIIKREMGAITNWQAIVPEGRNILVSLRKLGDSGEPPSNSNIEDSRPLVLHPVGTLRVSQRKLPLNIELDKVGNQRPSDASKLSITSTIGGNAFKEKFATGEFRDLGEAEKLSEPGFALYDGGIEIRPPDSLVRTSKLVKRVIRYETIIIDNNFKRHRFEFFLTPAFYTAVNNLALFQANLIGNAVSKSTLSDHFIQQIKPTHHEIKLEPSQFTVAFNDTNKPLNTDSHHFADRASAHDYMRAEISKDPRKAEQLHVIPNTEVNTAA